MFHLGLEVRDYRCRLCPKTFRHSTDLSRHKKTHKDKRPFKCKFPGCGKDYTDHSGLRKHLSLHHPNEKSSKHNNINNNNSVNQSYSAGASVPVLHTIFEFPLSC